jgi:hypothetical protein
MVFSQAFHCFKVFFHKKTGIEWDQRLEGIKMPEDDFVYTPPALGRPVGNIPTGYVRPELREDQKERGEERSGESEDEEVVYDTDSEVEDSDSEEDTNTIPTRFTVSRAASEFGFSGSEGAGSGSVENDGLGGVFELVKRLRTPPTVIYISD